MLHHLIHSSNAPSGRLNLKPLAVLRLTRLAISMHALLRQLKVNQPLDSRRMRHLTARRDLGQPTNRVRGPGGRLERRAT
jgi:hypothetical protein